LPVLGEVEVPSDFELPKNLSEERLDIYRRSMVDPQNIADGFKDTNDTRYKFLMYLKTVEDDPQMMDRCMRSLEEDIEDEKLISGPAFKDYTADHKECRGALTKYCILLGMNEEEGKETLHGFSSLPTIRKYV